MRKSINVETVFGTLTKEVLAKGWKARIGDWLSFLSSSAFGSEQWKKYETAIKADIEFAKANIELLSEEDYKWLLGYTSGLTLVSTDTVDSTNDVTPSFNCKICCDGHFSASDVQGKTIKSDVEVIAEFKKLIPGFTAASDKLKVGDVVATESQSTRWIVQITIGKDIYYRTLKTKNRMSPSIYDAKCYVSENAAKQAIVTVVAENASDPAMYFWAIVAKEVLCTETSSRTIEIVKKPKKSMDIDSPEFKKALASAPFVCKTHCESEEEEDNLPDSPENHPAYTVPSKISALTDEFNKLPPYDSLASSTVKGAINKSKLTIAATESQKKLWVVQITKGKKVWYKTSGSFKDGYVSPSIDDASLYYTKADAAYFATFIKPGNTRIYNLPFPVKVMLKEVVYTENASRTIELVKPTDSTVKKVRKSKKVYLIQDKKTKQYVTKVDHSNFTEVDLDKSLSEARLYTSMGNADSDCKYLSRYKDTNCKVQLEVVEMPDDEKFVLWSNGSLEFFVRIDSTGIRTTKNIDEAAKYVSYKSASTAVKKTDKELPYRFSISTVKNVKPLVVPVFNSVKKVKKPKVKEEWVLYQATPTSTFYYQSAMLGWSLVPKLEDATKFPSYSAATRVNFELAKTDILGLEVGESKDFE